MHYSWFFFSILEDFFKVICVILKKCTREQLLRRHLPNGDKNSITLSEYHDFKGVGIFFLTIIVLKKKPPSHRKSAKIGIQMVI